MFPCAFFVKCYSVVDCRKFNNFSEEQNYRLLLENDTATMLAFSPLPVPCFSVVYFHFDQEAGRSYLPSFCSIVTFIVLRVQG